MTPRVAEHSEDLGAAESAESAGLIGIGGGIVGDGTGTEGQGTIRTDRTCGSWKAGKCQEPGGNPEGKVKPEKDRRDRRTTIEEEEDVEKRRMMTEAAGGGRSIGSGETRKVNRDNRKRRKSRRRSKVDTEAHGGARGRNVPERPKSRSSREGRLRKMSESSAKAETPRSEKGTRRGMKIDLNKVKVVEEVPESSAKAEGSRGRKRKSRMGEGKEVKKRSLPHHRVRTRVRDRASRNWTEGRNVEGDQGMLGDPSEVPNLYGASPIEIRSRPKRTWPKDRIRGGVRATSRPENTQES
ncbi:hypothetical protein DFH06DRAFT_1150832 [Mycena polygramma]|nr:hypothetical protein DFH06DRAFT_1150832 [Mycena polygramma]